MLLDENETLHRLKKLAYLERICDKVGTISASNGGSLLAQHQGLVRQMMDNICLSNK